MDETRLNFLVFTLLVFLVFMPICSGSFTVDNSITIQGLQYSSQSWTIYNSKPDLDLAICGQTDSSPSNARTLIYTVNSTTATIHYYNITNATACTIHWSDIDNNGYDDLIVGGNSSKGFILEIYTNNGTDLILNQSLTGIFFGNAITGDLDNDGDLDLVSIGCESHSGVTCTIPKTRIYLNTQSNFVYDAAWSQNLAQVWKGSIALGDYTNDGYLDLALSGTTSSDHTGAVTRLYSNTQTGFIQDTNNDLYGLYWGSLAFEDYDNDGDLDLFMTGKNTSGNPTTTIFNSDQENYYSNEKPSAPSTLTSTKELISDYNYTIHLSWNAGSDIVNTQPITTGLYYNIQIGNSTTMPYTIISGLSARSSNPTQGYFGNAGQHFSYNFTAPNHCIFWQVQTIDQGMKASDWSSFSNISFAEICDMYDNDCVGGIDNGCDLDGDGARNENLNCTGSYLGGNGQQYSCSLQIDCNDNDANVKPTLFGGLEIDNNGIDDDCVGGNSTSGATANSYSTGEGGSTGQAVTAFSNQYSGITTGTNGQTVVTNIELPSFTPPSTESPSSTKPAPIIPVQTLEEKIIDEIAQGGVKRTFKATRIEEKTLITEKLKNLGLEERSFQLTLNIPKYLAKSTDELIPVDQFYIIQKDPIISYQGNISSFNTTYLQYKFNKILTDQEVENIIATVSLRNLSEEQKDQLKGLIKNTSDASTTNQTITRDIINNKTTIGFTINVDKEKELYNISIFQEIPKCLVEIINKEAIESKNKNFEIINADPLIVWHFDKIVNVEEIQFSIQAIADENCSNQVRTLAVAKNILIRKDNDHLNPMHIWFAVLIIPLLAFFLIWFEKFSTKIKHDNDELHQITEQVRQFYKKGARKEQVREWLIKEGHPIMYIDDCLHLHTESKFQYWIHRLEFGADELILLLLITFNILEFLQVLPGDANYLQKVMAFLMMGFLIYKISITDLLFGQKKPWLDVTLILLFFTLTFKNIISFANTIYGEAELTRDLLNYLYYHNDFFESTLFVIAIAFIGIISWYIAISIQPKAPSVITTLHAKEHLPSTLFGIFWRAGGVFLLLIAFFVMVFNLIMEWLALALDSTVLVFSIAMMLIIFIKHHHKLKFTEFMEETSHVAENFYEKFIELFHYKKTIFLGIVGMLILHLLTEIGNFIIPYLTGKQDALYFGNFNEGHLPLFSFVGDSLFSLQTVGTTIWTKLSVGLIYVLNSVAIIFLLVIPALIWYHYFKNREKPLSDVDSFVFHNHNVFDAIITGLFAASLLVLIMNPAFNFQSIANNERLTGVDIQTQMINTTNIAPVLLAALCIFIGVLLLAYFHEVSWLIIAPSFMFLSYYTLLYMSAVSAFTFTITQVSTLLTPFITLFRMLFGSIQLIFLYSLGVILLFYICLPHSWRVWMQHIPFVNAFLHKHDHHHTHHADEHQEHLHGTKEEHIEEFILKSLDSGHELFIIIEQLEEHGWSLTDIKAGLNKAQHNPKYQDEIKHVLHQHHDVARLKILSDWIMKSYQTHDLKTIIHAAQEHKWTDDDIIYALQKLRNVINWRTRDKELMEYLKIT